VFQKPTLPSIRLVAKESRNGRPSTSARTRSTARLVLPVLYWAATTTLLCRRARSSMWKGTGSGDSRSRSSSERSAAVAGRVIAISERASCR
jgi:hypothetical protein